MVGEMRVMGAEGDVKVIWDSEKTDEVESARKQFKELTDKGYIAFSVKKNGEQNEKISKFDPDLEKMILVPMLRGG
jgi:hypothetical protein